MSIAVRLSLRSNYPWNGQRDWSTDRHVEAYEGALMELSARGHVD